MTADRVPRVSRVLIGVALVVALASCSHGSSHDAAAGGTTVAPHAAVLVTIGSDATFGIGLTDPLSDSWPQRLYHDAFPETTVLVNAADRAVNINGAETIELPLALEQHATVAAVWLGDVDLATGIPAAAFEAKLDDLVKRLRDSGARVLLGNISTAQPGALAYDNAIANVARTRGATLVDLASALSATPDIGPSSAVTPTTSMQIADAFAAAIARP